MIEQTKMLPGSSEELSKSKAAYLVHLEDPTDKFAEVPVGRLGMPGEIADTVLWMVNTSYGMVQIAPKVNPYADSSSNEQGHRRGRRDGSTALSCHISNWHDGMRRSFGIPWGESMVIIVH